MTTHPVVESKIRARTFAKGLFSALAHDLELDLPIADATIEQLDDGTWSGRIVVSIEAIRVIGVLRRGAVVTDVLSAGDRGEIEKRLREACAPAKTLMVTASGHVDESGKAKRVEAHAMLENKVKTTLRTDAITLRPNGERRELRAEGTVSIRGLGMPEIKAPLNAFAVKDDVRFEAILTLG
jgi:hypothetical protein